MQSQPTALPFSLTPFTCTAATRAPQTRRKQQQKQKHRKLSTGVHRLQSPAPVPRPPPFVQQPSSLPPPPTFISPHEPSRRCACNMLCSATLVLHVSQAAARCPLPMRLQHVGQGPHLQHPHGTQDVGAVQAVHRRLVLRRCLRQRRLGGAEGDCGGVVQSCEIGCGCCVQQRGCVPILACTPQLVQGHR